MNAENNILDFAAHLIQRKRKSCLGMPVAYTTLALSSIAVIIAFVLNMVWYIPYWIYLVALEYIVRGIGYICLAVRWVISKIKIFMHKF